MHDTDILVAIAQIAIGLAGFTGVASVLEARREDAAHSRAQAERLRGMIQMALIAAGAALLPIVIARTGASEAAAWRISAGFFLAVAAPTLVSGIRRAVRVNREASVAPSGMTTWRLLTSALAGVILLTLAACLGGVVSPAASYLLALYVVLVFSGLLFLRFFLAGHQRTGG